jgi:hypothetical protein
MFGWCSGRPLALVVVLGAAFVGACGGKGGATPTNTPLLPKATAPIPATLTTIAIPQAILDSFYPEFKGTGLKVAEALSPRLASRIPIRIYNLSPHGLRQDPIQAIYNVIDQLSVTDLDLPGLDEAGKTSIVAQQRQPRSITVVIIPEGATKPRSTVSEFLRTRNPSAASAFGRGGEVFSYVELKPGDFGGGLYSDYGTLGIAVEACQELLEAVVLDEKKQQLDDQDMQQDAQEFLCNSIGGAVAARSLGLTYDQYETYSRSHAIRVNKGLIPAIELVEDVYDSYPSRGAVVE